MSLLPEQILKLVSPEDRAKIGKAGRTAAEAQAVAEHKNEREMQQVIRQWLDMKGWHYGWQTFGLKVRGRVGTPDFVICVPFTRGVSDVGLFVAIECKMPGFKLKPDQEKEREKIEKAHGLYLVATSAKEAIDFLINLTAETQQTK